MMVSLGSELLYFHTKKNKSSTNCSEHPITGEPKPQSWLLPHVKLVKAKTIQTFNFAGDLFRMVSSRDTFKGCW